MSKGATARRIAETIETVWPNVGMEGYTVDAATAVIRKVLEGYRIDDNGEVWNADGQRMWCDRDDPRFWYPERPDGGFSGLRPVRKSDLIQIAEQEPAR